MAHVSPAPTAAAADTMKAGHIYMNARPIISLSYFLISIPLSFSGRSRFFVVSRDAKTAWQAADADKAEGFAGGCQAGYQEATRPDIVRPR